MAGKATARAFSNIALVKYWGKGDEQLRLPVNSSVAVGLDQIFTDTTVEVSSELQKDGVEIDGDAFSDAETERVSEHLNIIRQLAKNSSFAKIRTRNNFPKGVGAASSASGFAALTLAAASAYGLQLSQKELSIIARQGSGSASRSVTGGFSVWHKGISNETSFAEKIEYPSEWDLRVLLVFVGDLKQKKIGSTEGMRLATTSPYFSQAVAEAEANVGRIQDALAAKDWHKFGQIIEAECYRLHMLCMTSLPSILYWNGTTVETFQSLYSLREQGVVGFFTVDAGPHVHIICHAKDAEKITSQIRSLTGVTQIVQCGIADEARVIDTHLF
jgi:diphosphomevalonate decarboxylase